MIALKLHLLHLRTTHRRVVLPQDIHHTSDLNV